MQSQSEFDEKRISCARAWFRAGIFLDKTKSPGGQGFRLKLHEKTPDAPLSPFYLNFRLLRSFPTLLQETAELMEDMVVGDDFDLVADIPTAATPLVTLISQDLQIPMITPREMKTHWSGAVIDGVYKKGQKVVVFDDLITKADSKIASAKQLTAEGLLVGRFVVLVDREQGGLAQLKAAGYSCEPAWFLQDLLGLYRHEGLLSPEVHVEIVTYLEA
jgi:orotate phosphoribosyltransferase